MKSKKFLALSAIVSCAAVAAVALVAMKGKSILGDAEDSGLWSLCHSWNNGTPDYSSSLTALEKDDNGKLHIQNSAAFVNQVVAKDFDFQGKTDYTIECTWYGDSELGVAGNEYQIGIVPLWIDAGSSVYSFLKYNTTMTGQGYYELWTRAVSLGVICTHWNGQFVEDDPDTNDMSAPSSGEFDGARVASEMPSYTAGGTLSVTRTRTALWFATPYYLDQFTYKVNGATILDIFYHGTAALDSFSRGFGFYTFGSGVHITSMSITLA